MNVDDTRTKLSTPDTELCGGQRYRRAAISGGFSMLAHAVQVATSLITVPLTLKYLGTERFGLWMTISSVLAVAAFADFGVGNGVLNTVAKAFDNFILARTLGAVPVPEYAIPQRLFTMISMMSAMLMTPLLPAYGEAMSRQDFV